jgi:tetratricopeptide (TPR) repeat protein
MKTTRLFIASSNELEADRKAFREYLSVLNEHLNKKGIHLDLKQWEYLPDQLSDQSKQDEYNAVLRECELMVCLFHTKAGKYTQEEFFMALNSFKERGKPRIFVYKKNCAEGEQEEESLADFIGKLNRERKFPRAYNDFEHLKNLFRAQLDLLEGNGFLSDPNTRMLSIPRALSQSIPKLNPDELIGRKEDLKELRTMLRDNKQVALVKGLGGIGKTTLAQAYVGKHWTDYQHIAWISMNSDQPELDFTTDPTLLKNLGINTEGMDLNALFSEVLNQMKRLGSATNLLVLDNAGQSLESIKNQLPQQPRWHVLVTSREELEGFSLKQLDFLGPDEAYSLFTKHAPHSPLSEEEIKKLIESVDYHTLTIEILAKSVRVHHYTYEDLRSALAENARTRVKTGHSQQQKIEAVTSYLCSIFKLHDLQPDERWLLRQFICLPPNFQPYELLVQLINPAASKSKNKVGGPSYGLWFMRLLKPPASSRETIFSETLDGLAKKGWLIRKEEDDAYKMHRIIGEVVKTEAFPELEDVLPLIESVRALLYIDQTKDNPVEKFEWAEYGEAVLEAMQPERNQKIADSKELMELMDALGSVFRELGQYQKAKKLQANALEYSLRINGEEHSDTARFQSNLAVVLKYLGKYEEAKKLHQKAVESAETNFGENHPETANRYSNLATALQDLGEYEEAKKMLQKALKSDELNFGENHPKTAIRYSNLALVLKDLGGYEEAKTMLQKALKSNETNFGENHPSTAISYSNLALVLQNLGEYKEAKKLHQKAVESAETNFGENHPETAICYSNLATVLSNLGEFEEAKKLLQKAIKSDESNFGENHPTTAIRYSNLATVLQSLGEFEEAKMLLEKAVESDESNFGENHPITAIRYLNLAGVLRDLGDLQHALSYVQKALTIFTKTLPEGHPHIKIAKERLINIQSKLK